MLTGALTAPEGTWDFDYDSGSDYEYFDEADVVSCC
jgi:hypothetical protein